jgi:NADH:ubiquinone oxidoreductase subunit 3 (subunit A)
MLCLLCGLFFVSFDFCLSSFYGLAIVYLSFDLRILITPLVSLHSSSAALFDLSIATIVGLFLMEVWIYRPYIFDNLIKNERHRQ